MKSASWALIILMLVSVSARAETHLGKYIRMATTTSVDNSGLLDILLPPFERGFGVKVKVLPVGTGQALKLGENGEVDLVLVHAPKSEENFIARGFGLNRRLVMSNQFVILGPGHDPAGIKRANRAPEALRGIALKKSLFISRGDESGTHKKEQALWQAAGINPGGGWYLAAGRGMGATLIMADEKSAYTLSDSSTYLSFKEKLSLTPLFTGGKELENPYSVIAINPARHRHVNYSGAMALIAWLTSVPGQGIIKRYKKHGTALFHPRALP